MSSVPPVVQRQLSDALSEISKHDFPDKWGALLPELVAQLRSAADISVVAGVLETAASIFERFRDEAAADDLAPLKAALDGFAAPLTEIFTAIDAQVTSALAANASVTALTPLFGALRLASKCFFLLNFVDLPEYFEDNISIWMNFFHKYIVLRVPSSTAAVDDADPGPVEALQSEIVECVDLYAKKYEEEFEPFMLTLVNDIWQLLSSMDARSMLAANMDALVSRTVRFLGDVVAKPALTASFSDEAMLTGIITRIVLPNMTLREIDLELLEDNPVGFFRGDIEGSASDTRRNVASDLVRAMCKSNSARVTPIVIGVVGSLLAQYEGDKTGREVSKDAAIALLMAVSIKTSTAAAGVTGVNEHVSLADMLRAHVLPELAGGADERPLARAACIKFVTSFRGLFGRDELHTLLPLLAQLLGSKHYVVHTYAAAAIERILSLKEPKLVTSPRQESRVSTDALTPLIAPILSALFARMAPTAGSEDNEYLMRCVMRVVATGRERCASVVPQVMSALTGVLGRVCRNPTNPSFNHYMFESIACLMRSSCTANPALVPDFENLLFPPLQLVLHNDVIEFLPYSFQLLASLLDLQPAPAAQAPLSDAFASLLPFLLAPALWQREGNLPGLTVLVCTLVRKAYAHISRLGALLQVLGLWQGLTNKKNCEQHGFALFNALAETVPLNDLRPHLPAIFNLMITRVTQTAALRVVREFVHSAGIFCGVHGAAAFAAAFDATPAVFLNVVGGLIAPQAHNVTGARNRRETAIGLIRLLCESPLLLVDASTQAVWGKVLVAVVSLADTHTAASGVGGSADTAFKDDDEALGDDGDRATEYAATHVRLAHAAIPEHYIFSALPPPHIFLVRSLQSLMSSPSQATIMALLSASPVSEKLRAMGLT